jgi:hypothetical protein
MTSTGRPRPINRPISLWHRARLAVNLANGSTIAGLGVALAGGTTLVRGPQGLTIATGYRPPVPAAAFTLGNVIIVNRRRPVPLSPQVLAHEARHATQYAWCGGLLMLPLYFAAAGASWALCGDVAAWNAFERQASLADGGYAGRPLRPALAQAVRTIARRGPAIAPPAADLAAGPAGPAGSSAIPSR